MTKFLVPGVLIAACGLALAKLPPLDDAAKAKAAEAAAKSAWQTKVDNFLLCKSQDKVAARYKSTAKAAPTSGTAPSAAPAAVQVTAAVAQPTSAGAKTGAPAQPAGSTAAAAGTPVAAAAAGPCSDPGPFAYNPPEQKPLETSGAHSPSGTAANPPSVKPNSAEMAPAKK
jgi:hypothetical protein